jgi:hypothetical protein
LPIAIGVLHAITTLAAEFTSPWTGKTYPPGTAVEIAETLRFTSKRVFSTPVPDAVALSMSVAVEASKRGDRLHTLLTTLAASLSSDPGSQVSLKSVEAEYFDGLQQLVLLAIFSYSAIEAFANLTIPEAHVYRRTRSDGRCIEEYDRPQIEKFIPLVEKVDAVLPAITEVASPKGTKLWERLVQLQRLRDRLIHLKPAEWRENQPEARGDTIWSDLLAPDVLTIYRTAVEIVSYFTPGEKPRWLQHLDGLPNDTMKPSASA